MSSAATPRIKSLFWRWVELLWRNKCDLMNPKATLGLWHDIFASLMCCLPKEYFQNKAHTHTKTSIALTHKKGSCRGRVQKTILYIIYEKRLQNYLASVYHPLPGILNFGH
jgi:hypothetical protein